MSDDHEEVDNDYPDPPERSTAPQSDYSMSDVLTGFVVMLVGVAITFGVPLLLA
ncbi:DUF7550 family protein [Halorientalis marina]|jgi:hypothetical protein|uniref:DUF7550 family protein n=1 Tax=Halorientalis marina TaxID=2931976 RepID=UPI001FF374C3|nr:hypothetical protein [Halorientalis marina]